MVLYLLEGNFGVGKSFMVEALSGFDIPVVSKTIISSEREGDFFLVKVTALEEWQCRCSIISDCFWS